MNYRVIPKHCRALHAALVGTIYILSPEPLLLPLRDLAAPVSSRQIDWEMSGYFYLSDADAFSTPHVIGFPPTRIRHNILIRPWRQWQD